MLEPQPYDPNQATSHASLKLSKAMSHDSCESYPEKMRNTMHVNMPRPRSTPFSAYKQHHQHSQRRDTLVKHGSSEHKRNSGFDAMDHGTIDKTNEVEADFKNPNLVSLAKFETMRVSVKNVNPSTKGKSQS